MSIRLSGHYPTSEMIRVHATSFVSKWSSESDKAVTNLFSHIETMLNEDITRFIFVFIDEVEALAGSCKPSTGSAEPSDMLRVRFLTLPALSLSIDTLLKTVNALVLALGALLQYPNVLVFCTTKDLDALVCPTSFARGVMLIVQGQCLS